MEGQEPEGAAPGEEGEPRVEERAGVVEQEEEEGRGLQGAADAEGVDGELPRAEAAAVGKGVVALALDAALSLLLPALGDAKEAVLEQGAGEEVGLLWFGVWCGGRRWGRVR